MKRVVAGSSSQRLANELSHKLGVKTADITIKRFPDGECYVKLNEACDHVIIVGNTYPDESIIELLLLQDAARRKAKTVEMVIPYFGYGRQDKIFQDGEAISAEKIARLVAQDADRVVIVNPHKEHILHFFTKDAQLCDGMPALARHFKNIVDDVIAPDKGALSMAQKASEIIGCSYDYFEKTRISGSEVKMEIKHMGIEGRRVLIIDDIISTGGTMVKAIEILREQHAKEVYAGCIHGLFAKGAAGKIMKSGCTELVVTDTIETAYSTVSVAEEVVKFL